MISWSLREGASGSASGIKFTLAWDSSPTVLCPSALLLSLLQSDELTRRLPPGRESAALVTWSGARIKMLLLSRGPRRETNSLGRNSPFKSVALFRKVIYPRAAASFCTRYIIDKPWHSSIHSGPALSLLPSSAQLSLTLKDRSLPLAGAKERCQKQGVGQGLTYICSSESLLRWHFMQVTSHFHSVVAEVLPSDSKLSWNYFLSHQQIHSTPPASSGAVSMWENVGKWRMHLKQLFTIVAPSELTVLL